MGTDHIDTGLLKELTEQSQDLNSDALRVTNAALADFAESSESTTRHWWQRRGTLLGAVGAASLLGAGRAAAASSTDIMALQTAASLENLAVSVYHTAAGLPFIRTGNKAVLAFITKTAAQHTAHAQAFNAAATKAGGKEQTGTDPKYAAVVKQTLPTLKTSADVVKLAISLEDVAAQTYTKNVGQVNETNLRQLFASVAPVEAQHRATLLAVQALLADGDTSLIAIPTDVAKLPASIGSVGFPDAFYPTKNASPVSEGAVK
ncbi:ferritin-like domain-containing protein [Streptomyces sp. NBC_01387]|uniref:ferritin-like domain-containing protein n=1 Tax=unclassified Streptomyces TaxID=2593676 RepID=UPI002024FDD5|nr:MULTISPECIES: ferritin-like domain-containing protein [unclassified Streptomyces]MCX4549746.1 ferritin-like domain-containing protein [Streptomyces sp. NBC_01500]WSC21269.1 ferritin-like domain-containing protein [Streptomyces sp. NBC_01766]WSV55205.1 ferritin-like domain-containing protein [Streptomyces sp. NBC_01014]